MADMTCPDCDGIGYTTDGAGEEILYPLCDGTGLQIGDESPLDTE